MRRIYIILEYVTIFLCGAFAYGMIELSVRGRTHITMGLLGGASLCLIHRLNSAEDSAFMLFIKMLFSSVCITAAELFTGLLLNVKLGLGIWNYSRLPHNLYGQICPAFSLIWFSLSGIGMLFDTAVRRLVFHHKESCMDTTVIETAPHAET